jgi:oxaloacetate decarboxylase alpha subunit
MGTATYVEGVRAGAGAIDCAISVMSSFSSQPPIETMLSIFDETPYHANVDRDALRTICKYFTDLTPKRRLSHQPLNVIDPEILIHHIPGGMISNLRSQLQQQDALDRLDEVLAELPRARADLGYPPLVTPTSQIVGVQSVMNVLSGERYSMVPQETKDYVKGFYGRSPAPIDPKVRSKILGKEKAITCRPADLLEPMLPSATQDVDPELIKGEEDIISYCLFPEPATEYFKWRALPTEERPSPPAELERRKEDAVEEDEDRAPIPAKPFLAQNDYTELHTLLEKVNELRFNELVVRRDDLTLSLKASGLVASRGRPSAVPEEAPADDTQAEEEPVPTPEEAPAAAAEDTDGPTIDAPLNGTFYKSPGPGKPAFVHEGDEVKADDPVCIVEAMKLFNQIKAPSNCKIVKFLAEHGDLVKKSQPLVAIEELA